MLTVTDLTKKYSGNRGVYNLNFKLGDKEIVGLLGPNGAGKSTTMRMLSGSLSPTSGQINILGDDMIKSPLKAKTHIGYLPEIPPLYTDLTVREHLGFICDLHHIIGERKIKEIMKVCKELSIADISERLISHLSKGYRQRVGFASAIIGHPKLLILDEPTVGLDPVQIKEVRKLICQLSQDMSVIISSHILSEIADICTRLIIIKDGRLIADDSIEDLAQSDKTTTVVTLSGSETIINSLVDNTVGCQSILFADRKNKISRYTILTDYDPRKKIFEASAKANNVTLLEMYIKKRTLEDIFINAVGGDLE